MICTIFAIKTYVFENIGIASFFALIVSGIFAYLLIAYLADLFFNYGSEQLIQEQIVSFFQKDKVG